MQHEGRHRCTGVQLQEGIHMLYVSDCVLTAKYDSCCCYSWAIHASVCATAATAAGEWVVSRC
jgi:hypothetical protein